ncbi:MAG: hypothetical protein WB440_10190 [Steroidobacteraceae bacterium]|jgi:hypothetical protein
MAPKKAGKTRSAETSTSTAGALRLPRISNGVRPEFYDDPAIDQLFAIVTALTGELSVVSDRLDTLERALVKGRSLESGAVEAFVPDADAVDQRARRREELLGRVFAVFEVYAAHRRPGAR